LKPQKFSNKIGFRLIRTPLFTGFTVVQNGTHGVSLSNKNTITLMTSHRDKKRLGHYNNGVSR